MLAVLLALAAAAGYGGSDFAAGLATRRASVVRVTVLAEVTSAALLLCVIPFVSSQARRWRPCSGEPPPEPAAWPGQWRCTSGSGTRRSAWLVP
jgi:hypothetical protein